MSLSWKCNCDICGKDLKKEERIEARFVAEDATDEEEYGTETLASFTIDICPKCKDEYKGINLFMAGLNAKRRQMHC